MITSGEDTMVAHGQKMNAAPSAEAAEVAKQIEEAISYCCEMRIAWPERDYFAPLIQAAIDAATASLREENERLKRELAAKAGNPAECQDCDGAGFIQPTDSDGSRPVIQCAHCGGTGAERHPALQRIRALSDALDMNNDEFQRIKSAPNCTSEIAGLCDRAMTRTKRTVPLIEECATTSRENIAALRQQEEQAKSLEVLE